MRAHQSGGVWAILSRFSSISADLHGELNGNHIHRLKNNIAMELNIHQEFDNLRLWFKAQPV